MLAARMRRLSSHYDELCRWSASTKNLAVQSDVTEADIPHGTVARNAQFEAPIKLKSPSIVAWVAVRVDEILLLESHTTCVAVGRAFLSLTNLDSCQQGHLSHICHG